MKKPKISAIIYQCPLCPVKLVKKGKSVVCAVCGYSYEIKNLELIDPRGKLREI